MATALRSEGSALRSASQAPQFMCELLSVLTHVVWLALSAGHMVVFVAGMAVRFPRLQQQVGYQARVRVVHSALPVWSRPSRCRHLALPSASPRWAVLQRYLCEPSR